MKKIWLVCEVEPLPIDGDNIRLRRVGQLAEMMADDGWEVHWFASDYQHYQKKGRGNGQLEINYKDHYYFHLLPGFPYKKNVSLSRVIHYKKISQAFTKKANQLEKPDLLLAMMAPLELSRAAIDYAVKNKIPTVVDVRDLWPDIYYEVVPQNLAWLLKPYVEYSRRKVSYTLHEAQTLTALTQGFLEYGQEVGQRRPEQKSRDRVFHMAYPRSLSQNHAQEKADQAPFQVIFVGNFGRQFVLDPLFQAAELLAREGVEFTFCGGGEYLEDYKKKYEHLTNVNILGWVDSLELKDLLLQSHVGVAPYRDSMNFRLNLPNKFGEYLSYHLPILVSVKGEMADKLQENQCGYYYENGQDLAKKIRDYKNNQELYQAHSQNAMDLFEAEFNAEVVYRQMITFLEKQLDENKNKQ